VQYDACYRTYSCSIKFLLLSMSVQFPPFVGRHRCLASCPLDTRATKVNCSCRNWSKYFLLCFRSQSCSRGRHNLLFVLDCTVRLGDAGFLCSGSLSLPWTCFSRVFPLIRVVMSFWINGDLIALGLADMHLRTHETIMELVSPFRTRKLQLFVSLGWP
jgi:hypothetical protein